MIHDIPFLIERLKLISQDVGNIKELINYTNIKIDENGEKLDVMNLKLDTIEKKLDNTFQAIQQLKNESRDIEEKITLMNLKLNRIEDSLDIDDYEDYYLLCQSSYLNWDRLEELTRKFIPVAEYLYSKLQKFQSKDYSPFVLQMCKAIENEFLLKIFRKFTLDFLKRNSNNVEHFLAKDAVNQQTIVFVKSIIKASRNGKTDYTLGQMNTILSLLTIKKNVDKSPLLHDFKEYILREYDSENLLDNDFINSIKDIVNNYRNPSAHPDYMDLVKAKKCKELIPDKIDYLIDCIVSS